ncbi:hypothetical protein B1813_06615 [Saccharomonospora piscinae]|uniref:N-acetyltransferase domain-containing protein n=1 Tax=Saccharomonospora piscinae TaxID=687388 RepID=A0A1V9A4E6_SACPI|nr:GNAT family N-acetyltransferase [Saccharomonospora piscinae]OQO91951.1 hypothetical protein B1813_06615 [Saccharomonospora piscinae]
MDEPADLVAEQAQRWARLDPLLPPPEPPPEPGGGHTLVATVAGGGRVTGVLDARTVDGIEVWELRPFVGDHGAAGMEALLRAWRAELDRAPVPDGSLCSLRWPSRDARGVLPLLGHGLLPVLALGVRLGDAEREPQRPRRPAVPVRRAGPADTAALRRLAARPTARSEHFAVAVPHSADRCARTETWVAEGTSRDTVIGLVEFEATTSPRPWLPESGWGLIHRVSVEPESQGTGVGSALTGTAHDLLAGSGHTRTAVWYGSLNPVASVFWHRQGYRPLWTVWQCRPASALR